MKKIVLHAYFSFLNILQTFSLFPQREMTCFAVVWTTRAIGAKCSDLSSHIRGAGSNLIPGQLKHNLQAR